MSEFAPHPLTLRQLQYVRAVAEARNFRRAAALCRVSQPSLSAQLAQLEGALGVRLFERDRRRVLLTPAGEELVARARRVLLEANDMAQAARRLADPTVGTVRLGVIPTISPYLLPEATPLLRVRHPRLAVQWIEDRTANLVAALETGGLDAALLAFEAPLGDLEREAIAEDPFVLAAPVGHPLARGGPARTGELRGASVLLLEDGHCLRDQALAVCSTARADELSFRATSLTTLTQMVVAGMGVTLLPRLALAGEARRAGLALRPLAAPVPHRTLGLVWRRRSPLSATLRPLAATLRLAHERLGPALERALAQGRARARRGGRGLRGAALVEEAP